MADGDRIRLGRNNDSVAMTAINCAGGGTAAWWVQNPNGMAGYYQAGLGGAGVMGDATDTGVGVAGQSVRGNGVVGSSGQGHGVAGVSYGDSIHSAGVRGDSDKGAGVAGMSFAEAGRGVWGVASKPGGEGVFGYAPLGSFGVLGDAPGSVGVRGDGGQVGVWGVGRGSGVGVRADSASNDAVVATSSGARGVVGTTLSNTGTGVQGIATSGGGTGVRAISSTGSGLVASSTSGNAAEFFGTVVVLGGFVAVGPFKAAAVPHPDGTHRLTYSMESPESWFEDFGRSRLSRGRAEIQLDPDLAALVRTDDFHVFLTAEGETAGLYVAERSETGFEVREQRGGDGEVPFSYRVVARRRDADGGRLAPFELPENPPEPEAVGPPDLPEPPDLPDLPPPEWPPRPGQQRE